MKLLLKFGANPNAEAYKKTPLQLAQELQFDDIVNLIVQHKPELNISMEEQKEATNCLIQEMVNAVDMSQDSTTCNVSQSLLKLTKMCGKGQTKQTVR